MKLMGKKLQLTYCVVVSTSPSHLEAHAGLFRMHMKGIFDAYVLWPFDKSFVFEFETYINTCDFTVCTYEF